jgi:RNA polymerase sigma-70 factor (ECF subfamily)
MDQHRKEPIYLTAEQVDAYYEQLVAQYWHQLRSFILRRTRNQQDAEDIVQEAFMHAYYALERYPLQQIRTLQARPWLYKITWNGYRNYMSRTKSALEVSLDTPENDLLLELDDACEERPEAVFERGERRRELETLVGELPENYREVINLYYFDDLSQQEIADLLNRPVGTIKTHVYRGIRMLRKALLLKEGESIK